MNFSDFLRFPNLFSRVCLVSSLLSSVIMSVLETRFADCLHLTHREDPHRMCHLCRPCTADPDRRCDVCRDWSPVDCIQFNRRFLGSSRLRIKPVTSASQGVAPRPCEVINESPSPSVDHSTGGKVGPPQAVDRTYLSNITGDRNFVKETTDGNIRSPPVVRPGQSFNESSTGIVDQRTTFVSPVQTAVSKSVGFITSADLLRGTRGSSGVHPDLNLRHASSLTHSDRGVGQGENPREHTHPEVKDDSETTYVVLDHDDRNNSQRLGYEQHVFNMGDLPQRHDYDPRYSCNNIYSSKTHSVLGNVPFAVDGPEGGSDSHTTQRGQTAVGENYRRYSTYVNLANQPTDGSTPVPTPRPPSGPSEWIDQRNIAHRVTMPDTNPPRRFGSVGESSIRYQTNNNYADILNPMATSGLVSTTHARSRVEGAHSSSRQKRQVQATDDELVSLRRKVARLERKCTPFSNPAIINQSLSNNAPCYHISNDSGRHVTHDMSDPESSAGYDVSDSDSQDGVDLISDTHPREADPDRSHNSEVRSISDTNIVKTSVPLVYKYLHNELSSVEGSSAMRAQRPDCHMVPETSSFRLDSLPMYPSIPAAISAMDSKIQGKTGRFKRPLSTGQYPMSSVRDNSTGYPWMNQYCCPARILPTITPPALSVRNSSQLALSRPNLKPNLTDRFEGIRNNHSSPT